MKLSNLLVSAKHFGVILGLHFLNISVISGQITFEKVYLDPATHSHAGDIVEVSPGNYVFSSERKAMHCYLAGINATGEIQWENNIPSTNIGDIRVYKIIQTPDNGFLLFGDSTICPNIACVNHPYVSKTDESGNLEWSKPYPVQTGNFFLTAKPVSDGGFLILRGGTDSELLKIDASGNLQWTKIYKFPSGQGHVDLKSFYETADNQYVLTGGGRYAAHDLIIYKINAVGDSLWSKTHPVANQVNDSDKGADIMVDEAGDLLILSNRTVSNGNSDIKLMKTDGLGNYLWSNIYGGDSIDHAIALQPADDGGFVILANTKSFGSGKFDIYLTKTDAQGNTLWSKTYGGPYDDKGETLKKTADGGFIIMGNSISDSTSAINDVYIIKTDGNGNVVTSTLESDVVNPILQIFPNPTGGRFIITSNSGEFGRIEIFNVLGALVYADFSSKTSKSNHELDLSGIPKGMYVALIQLGGSYVLRKIEVR